MAQAPKRSVRLSPNVTPTKYEINLKPDLEAFVFEGEETIHLNLKKPTRALTLHAKELEIEAAAIVSAKEPHIAEKISYDESAETVTLLFASELKGSIQVRIIFRGVLNDKMHGFYRSSYEREGKTHYIATTQFESTDARRAFPCFDEPAMKAVFEISLNVLIEHEAISNTMPIKTTKTGGGRKIIRFGPSPRMSTYLLAFIVGEFEHIEKKSANGILLRIFTTPGKKHQARFALDCAARTVDFFNDYFACSYPLAKLDQIAIPDFSAGAMENWGAITYRESALLVDPKQSSTMNKQWVALVIAHEIAHQWFGNLVTMEWWTHLWLNEGFASYIEYLAVDHLFPNWDIWTQFLQSDHGAALHYDGLKHTHPIEIEVHHPAEIASVFDAVSYSKGASIIRMIAEYLGEETFRNGLRYYLKRHSYQNAQTSDLWDALEKVSGKPVAKIMANWTSKPGYPLLTVTEKGGKLQLSQTRFFASPLSQKSTKDSTLWHVPVNYETDAATDQLMLTTRQESVTKPKGAWLKLNTNESGFYRTAYPETMRQALAVPLREKRLNTRDRLGLMRDIHAIAETGHLSSVDCLSFVQHYKEEDQYVVWGAVAGTLGKIHSLIVHEPSADRYRSYAIQIFSDVKGKIHWNSRPKSHSDALLKVLVLESLVKYGDEETIAHARKLFDAVTEKKNDIPPDLRGVVYGAISKYGNSKEYAQLMKMYRAESLHEEKNRIGRALGMFRKPQLLNKTLDFALSKAVRPQDSVRMVSGVTVNPIGADLAWRFIKQNWSEFQKRYAGTRELSYLLEPLGVSTSASLAKELEAFLKKHPAPGTERTVLQVLERIRSNAAWLARDSKKIESYLRS